MNEEQRYQKTLESIRWLSFIVKWKLPKGRNDLRCYEILENENFRKAIKQYLYPNEHKTSISKKRNS